MSQSNPFRSTRRTRPMFALLAILTLFVASATFVPDAATAKAPVAAQGRGEMPTTGGIRPGPIGLKPPEPRGVRPVGIQIADAQVDAQVEVQKIDKGVMLNPSGPWVVAWYDQTGWLGQPDNIVMAGHLDYWDVGQAVFYNVGSLQKGDEILVFGEDGETYTYKVDWVQSFVVEDLTKEQVQDIVGKTSTEKLTLITCGGPWDAEAGVYLERTIVRATRAD